MTIQVKVRIMAILSAVLAVSFGLVVLWSSQVINIGNVKSKQTDSIIAAIHELNILTNDYISNRSERVIIQWQSRHNSMSLLLESSNFTEPEEQAALAVMDKQLKNVGIIFNKIINNYERHIDIGSDSEIFQEYEELLVGHVLVQSQKLLINTQELQEISVTKGRDAQQQAIAVGLTFAIILAIIPSANLLIVNKAVVFPILKLRRTTEIIARGDLEYEANVGGKDEIGQLSKSFNEMTRKLRSSYNDLEQDIIERKRIEGELRRSEQQLRLLSQRVIEAQEDERKRIARELHDQLGQELTALRIEVASLAENLATTSELFKRAQALVNTSDRLAAVIHRISVELRPAILDRLGLFKAVQWYVEEFERETGISCPVDVGTADVELPETVSIAAYRILQEALSNVRRHARPTQACVDLRIDNNALILRISDDGIGFNSRRAKDAASLGLLGMHERAILVGGMLVILSEINKGTSVEVRFPLVPETTETKKGEGPVIIDDKSASR